jgi:hypothetical protein
MKCLLREAEVDPVFVTASRMDGIPGHRFPFWGGPAPVPHYRLSRGLGDIYIKRLIYSMAELKWF